MNWNNPDDDFIGVRINRNINFPALSIDQGNMIYSGNQESFEDMDVEDGIKAKITLYELNKEESWEIWNGKKFNQENPQMTGYDGNFGFIVPNGEYKIVVEKNNYISKNKIIEVENNIINSKIEIKGKNNWPILIIALVILFVIFIIAYRKRRKIV